MNRIIYTNLPEDAREFAIMQKCFSAMGLPFQLRNCVNAENIEIEKYINNNNVFFHCTNERDQKEVAIEKACCALHRIIINFGLINTSEKMYD